MRISQGAKWRSGRPEVDRLDLARVSQGLGAGIPLYAPLGDNGVWVPGSC